MNPQAPTRISPGPLVLTAIVLIAALTRVLPHPPNFSPVEAVALFGGAYFASRAWALAVPLIAMLASDLVLGLVHGGIYFEYFVSAHFVAIYLCIALSTILGFNLRGRVGAARVVGYSLAGSALFFVFSNFAVWLTATPGHGACNLGLAPCYVAALPFFQWTVLGTLFYGALMFGGFELLRSRMPQLQPHTV
ncbi:MAG TPA: DUF6580 family putative transport protein [Xanthomonadaceae bacterium]|nr:DUF6580 family putative transport protein [Xanthomonadaceae bacterium]